MITFMVLSGTEGEEPPYKIVNILLVSDLVRASKGIYIIRVTDKKLTYLIHVSGHSS